MKMSRRGFLIGSALAGTGLMLGLKLRPDGAVPNSVKGSFQPNAWLQILPSGEVIFQCDKSEMGQGAATGLATLIGEELDFEPTALNVEFAGIHPAFRNSDFALQLTGGSTSIKVSWSHLRHAGALARQMLLQAASQQLGLSVNDLTTEPGFVVSKDGGERISYGDLAETAKGITIPSDVSLKSPSEYRWLGKNAKRVDTEAKVHTTATFGVDVDLPELKTAVIVRSPYFGGKLKRWDASLLADNKHIIGVKEIHSGLAIVAIDYWQARKAANAIFASAEWDKGPLAGTSNDSIEEAQFAILNNGEESGHFTQQTDNTATAISNADSSNKIIDAEYKVGYFHHSPMEPQNATAHYDNASGKLTLWAPSQSPDIARAVASHYANIDMDNITVHTTYLGGGFGRRGYVDFCGEAAAVAKAFPNMNIRTQWSREDDMQHDYYRPTSAHKLSASLDSNGKLAAWRHNLVSNSILNGFGVDMFSALLPSWLPLKIARGIGRGISNAMYDYDISMAEGANPEYDIAEREIGINFYDSGVPTGFWRSVGHSYNGFVKESMIDEMAHLANADPLQFRLDHLNNSPRLKACLEQVKLLSNWDIDKPKIYKGVACHMSFLSYVAQVVEISADNGQVKLEKVYCVADVGIVVNPNIVEEQLSGGTIYGLTAAIKPHVKIEDGKVMGSNFHDMPVMRMNECPDIEVAVIDSLEDPTGVGEIAVPPIAAALGNALYKLTGKRQRELPLNMSAQA